MNHSIRNRLQSAVYGYAKAAGWDVKGIPPSAAECVRLVRENDGEGYDSVLAKYSKGGGLKKKHRHYFLQDYCALKQIKVSVRREKNRQAAQIASKPDVSWSSVMGDGFLQSYEWRRVRMQVLKRDGAVCACCGASPETGAVMNVDHIKPRRMFPQLALDMDNLQVLCNACNHGKGNWDMTDWRRREPVPDPAEEFKERFG